MARSLAFAQMIWTWKVQEKADLDFQSNSSILNLKNTRRHDKNISDYLKHKDVSATYNQIANINGPSIIITLA